MGSYTLGLVPIWKVGAFLHDACLPWHTAQNNCSVISLSEGLAALAWFCFLKCWDPCPETRKVQRYNFILFWVPPCLLCPGFTLLKLSPALGGSSTRLCLRDWVGAVPSRAAADSPPESSTRGAAPPGSGVMQWARPPPFWSPSTARSWGRHTLSDTACSGPGNRGGSQQRGSTRAVASLCHRHPPTSSPANSNSWDVTKHIQESQTARSQTSHPMLPLCCLRSVIINYQFFRNAINLTAV